MMMIMMTTEEIFQRKHFQLNNGISLSTFQGINQIGRQWNIHKLISWPGGEVKNSFNRIESVAIDFLGDRTAEG